jgi:hypothetical protein
MRWCRDHYCSSTVARSAVFLPVPPHNGALILCPCNLWTYVNDLCSYLLGVHPIALHHTLCNSLEQPQTHDATFITGRRIILKCEAFTLQKSGLVVSATR